MRATEFPKLLRSYTVVEELQLQQQHSPNLSCRTSFSPSPHSTIAAEYGGTTSSSSVVEVIRRE